MYPYNRILLSKKKIFFKRELTIDITTWTRIKIPMLRESRQTKRIQLLFHLDKILLNAKYSALSRSVIAYGEAGWSR